MPAVPVHASQSLPQLNARVRVLLLGGWTSGPLAAIRASVTVDEPIDFLQPALHMPPIGTAWAATWEALLLGCCVWIILALLISTGVWVSMMRPEFWMCCISLPPLTVMLIRGSVRRCVSTARFRVDRHRVDVVVGYSWGGGIACWLLADNGWRGPTLLLAPAVTAMASAARLPRPHFRASSAHADRVACAPFVQIVHAAADRVCPASQQPDLERTGALMRVCDDGHALCRARSQEVVLGAFARCVEAAQRRKQVDGITGSERDSVLGAYSSCQKTV